MSGNGSLKGPSVTLSEIPAQPMFALLIGIDHYESSQVSDLRGCNKDVTAIHKWLTNSYNLLQDNTHVLRNKQATAKSIRDAIRNHLIDNDSIGRDTPIVIFFAGHGSRISPAFPEDDHIELICAFDHHVSPQIGDPKIEEKRPICDYEVADLISELASKRGNNITIILDCCHSGGINRREGIRECETDIGWRNYLVKGCNASRNVGVGLPRAGWYCDWESHILLAACEPEQSAGESAEGGRFTCALLGRFEQVGRGATYSQLMSGLSISTYQNPQCTGTHRNRTLFTLHTSGPLLTVGPGDNDSSISLPVGEFHGIREQSLFELRQVGALVGEFCVMAVTATSCFVQPVVPQTRIPEIGSLVDATILRYSNSEPVIFYVDSADIPLTSQISSLGVSSLAGGVNIKFVPNRACAHITISPHNGGYSTDLISVTQGPRFSATDNNSVIDAIGLAARFYLHLHRSCSAVLAPQVKLRLFKLLRGKLEEIPNVNGRANIAPGKFVLVIENKSNDDLFCYLMMYQCSSHTIMPFYVPDTPAMRPPLRVNQTLSIGVGAVCRHPIEFTTRADGHGPTVDYLKVFISTKYTTVDIFQQGPELAEIYDESRKFSRVEHDTSLDLWNAKILEVHVEE